jgi:hypothetical protein
MDSSLDTLYVLAPPFAAKEGGFTWRWFRWLIPNWIPGCVRRPIFNFPALFLSQMFPSIWISAKLTIKYWLKFKYATRSLFPLNCNGSNFVWKECNKSACITSELKRVNYVPDRNATVICESERINKTENACLWPVAGRVLRNSSCGASLQNTSATDGSVR